MYCLYSLQWLRQGKCLRENLQTKQMRISDDGDSLPAASVISIILFHIFIQMAASKTVTVYHCFSQLHLYFYISYVLSVSVLVYHRNHVVALKKGL